MSITISATNPEFIPSANIEVFPCAGRGEGAAKYTSEFNLTHLGLPDISWIVGVKDSTGNNKASGNAIAATDTISLIINGYFFEFKPGTLPDSNPIYASILLSRNTDSGADAVQKQWKLTPIAIGSDISKLPTDFDVTPEGTTVEIFYGIVLTSEDDPLVVNGALENTQLTIKTLQLTDDNGNYIDVGKLPISLVGGVSVGAVGTAQLKDDAVTAAKLGAVVDGTVSYPTATNTTARLGVKLARNTSDDKLKAVFSGKVQTTDIANDAVTIDKIDDGAVDTDQIADEAVVAAKLGEVINSDPGKLGTETTNTLQVKLVKDDNKKIKAELSGSVGTADIADDAVTAAKLGTIIGKGSATANGFTVSLSQDDSGLSIGLFSNGGGGGGGGDTDVVVAQYLFSSKIDQSDIELNQVGDNTDDDSLGVKLEGGYDASTGDKNKLSAQLTGGVATKNIYNKAVTAAKLGAVIDDAVSNLTTDDTATRLGVKLAQNTDDNKLKAVFSGKVQTTDIANKAITKDKLGSDVVDSTPGTIGDEATGNLGVKLTGGNGAAIKAELTGKVDRGDIADYAVGASNIADAAVNLRILGSDICWDGPRFLNNEDGLGVQLTGGDGDSLTAKLVGGVSTDNIKDGAVTVDKLATAMFDNQCTTDSGLTSTVSVINGDGGVKKLVTNIEGQCKSAFYAENAAALTGQLNPNNVPNDFITTGMFDPTAEAPKADVANSIMISGKACTITFDASTGVLTFVPPS